MNIPRVEASGESRYRVIGSLVFDTVPVLWQETQTLFFNPGELSIDLGGVDEADSSALALLLDWLRQARARQVKLQLQNAPASVLSMARLGGVRDLLPVVH